MRKLILLAALLLIFPLIGKAQSAPKAEIFGGYSYLHADDADDGLDLHGWNASAAINFTKYAGIVADFSGHYDTATLAPGVRADLSAYLFLVGPRFTYREHKVLQPFGHVLLGAARSTTKTLGPLGTVKFDDSAFAMAVGGGLDAKVHDNLAIRLFQADYVLTRFNDDSQHNFRLSTGLVLRLGSQ
ncbi:MAG: outer membrane beta-barrel protein [Acidobacteria bacterium]|nr:outer membrane beta-barrel protein [Acidobacteriota bacterium]